jgi:hypothetical protein
VNSTGNWGSGGEHAHAFLSHVDLCIGINRHRKLQILKENGLEVVHSPKPGAKLSFKRRPAYRPRSLEYVEAVRQPAIEIQSQGVPLQRPDRRLVEGHWMSLELLIKGFREPDAIQVEALAASGTFSILIKEERTIN